MSKKLIITGCPRSGTGYTAKIFQANGFDIGHEKMGKHGTSNWCITSGSENLLYGETCENGVIVHQIRNPIDCISSICGIRGKSWRWVDKFYPVLYEKDIIKRSATFWVNWNRMAERVSIYSVKIEELTCFKKVDIIINMLGWKYSEKPVLNIPKNINTNHKFEKPIIKMSSLPLEVQEYADKWGYLT